MVLPSGIVGIIYIDFPVVHLVHVFQAAIRTNIWHVRSRLDRLAFIHFLVFIQLLVEERLSPMRLMLFDARIRLRIIIEATFRERLPHPEPLAGLGLCFPVGLLAAGFRFALALEDETAQAPED